MQGLDLKSLVLTLLLYNVVALGILLLTTILFSGGDSDSSQPERKKSHKILAFLKLGGNP